MTTSSIRDAVIDTAMDSIREHGESPPALAIEAKQGDAVLLLPEYGALGTDQKYQTIHKIGAIVGFGLEATKVYFVMDTWFSQRDKEDDTPIGRPSEDPNRKSALVVVSAEYGKAGISYDKMLTYETNEDGKVTFTEVPTEKATHISGVLEGFFEGIKWAEDSVSALFKSLGHKEGMATARKAARKVAIESGFLQKM